MSLNHRQQRQLCRIESRLLLSDPQLAAKLDVFGKLSAGQQLPAWEHIASRLDRVLALLTAFVMGRRVCPAQPGRQQTGQAANGRPDAASWS
jgi:Protein of unknown function (DUF3040)